MRGPVLNRPKRWKEDIPDLFLPEWSDRLDVPTFVLETIPHVVPTSLAVSRSLCSRSTRPSENSQQPAQEEEPQASGILSPVFPMGRSRSSATLTGMNHRFRFGLRCYLSEGHRRHRTRVDPPAVPPAGEAGVQSRRVLRSPRKGITTPALGAGCWRGDRPRRSAPAQRRGGTP
jgi:hypothetical protein